MIVLAVDLKVAATLVPNLANRSANIDLLAFFHAIQVIRDQTTRRKGPAVRREVRLDAQSEGSVFFVRQNRRDGGIRTEDSLIVEVYRENDVLADVKSEATLAPIYILRKLESVGAANEFSFRPCESEDNCLLTECPWRLLSS